jgi:hypothetical protein
MERTVVKGDENTPVWVNSSAYDKSIEGAGVTQPLDLEIGAGHLNAKRAVQQFAGGEHDNGTIPAIGWDYGNITNNGVLGVKQYEFGQKLVENSFISITLAWDRVVEFATDNLTQNVYDDGDVFTTSGSIQPYPGWDQYSDLDLYLLPEGATNINQAIAASASNSNVEHLFFQIPETGNYEFWVYKANDNAGPVNYGLAWWALAEQPQAGDFNGDGNVDGADFVVWQDNFPLSSGATLADGDADGDGDVDGADFIAWQTNFPFTPGTGTSPVPEPPTIFGLASAAIALAFVRRKAT